MKIITLHQPWASLVALGLKRYETRHWPTSYRGALLIHAAKRKMNETELCLLTKDLPTPLEIAVGNWKVGRFGFKLENPVALPDPIPFTSRQGKLLDAPVEIVADVRAQLKGVA